LGLTLAQVAVQDKTNEIGVVRDLLSKLVVEGHVFTADALLTQRELATDILARGGDYVFVVKRNQPQLHADIALLFASPPPRPRGETWPAAERGTAAHGRIERRWLTPRPAKRVSPSPGTQSPARTATTSTGLKQLAALTRLSSLASTATLRFRRTTVSRLACTTTMS
jgi:hypothetical protein